MSTKELSASWGGRASEDSRDSSVGDSNSDEREQVCLSFLPFEL